MFSRNLPSCTLNELRLVIRVKFGGRIFHNLDALIKKLSSNLVRSFPFTLGKGFMRARIELVLAFNLNSKDTVFE